MGFCSRTTRVVKVTMAPRDRSPCATAMPPMSTTNAIVMLGISVSNPQKRARKRTMSNACPCSVVAEAP